MRSQVQIQGIAVDVVRGGMIVEHSCCERPPFGLTPPQPAGLTPPQRAGLTPPQRAGLTPPQRAGLTPPQRAERLVQRPHVLISAEVTRSVSRVLARF
eukprot:7151547-Prymnesium_polylepis.1